MGWGTTLRGFSETMAIFDAIEFAFSGEEDVMYVCGPTVKYAVYHELGTSKMEARPFARPAAERVQTNLETHIQRHGGGATEASVVRAAALGVQEEMVNIITQKGIVDTGAMRASVSIERVQ